MKAMSLMFLSLIAFNANAQVYHLSCNYRSMTVLDNGFASAVTVTLNCQDGVGPIQLYGSNTYANCRPDSLLKNVFQGVQTGESVDLVVETATKHIYGGGSVILPYVFEGRTGSGKLIEPATFIQYGSAERCLTTQIEVRKAQ